MQIHLRRRQLLAIAAAMSPVMASGQGLQAAPGAAVAGDAATPDAGPALPAGARRLRDLAYGPHPRHRLDVYIPAQARDAPLLFMVHGGAWMLGDKAHRPVVEAKLARWLPKGYIVVSTNYRLAARPDVLEQMDDVARALAYTQAQAAQWGGDASRTVVMGHSAGAHLVALLAAADDVAWTRGVRPWTALVSLDTAALDVVDLMQNRHHALYDRVFGNDRAHWAAASPYHRLQQATAPMLLVCASGRPDACTRAQAFAARQRQLGGAATVLPVELSHEDINAMLGLPGAYTGQVEAFLRGLGLP